MRRHLLLVAVQCSLSLGAGPALAMIPSPDGTFYACTLKRLGTLRLIDRDAGQRCNFLETLVSWTGAVQGLAAEQAARAQGDADVLVLAKAHVAAELSSQASAWRAADAALQSQVSELQATAKRLVVVERSAYCPECAPEVLGPFISTSFPRVDAYYARPTPVLTYWRDGVFYSRYASGGISYSWAAVEKLFWTSPDCGFSSGQNEGYLDHHPPVPFRHVFNTVTEGGSTRPMFIIIPEIKTVTVQIQSEGAYGRYGCTQVTPYSAQMYLVQRVEGFNPLDGTWELWVEER